MDETAVLEIEERLKKYTILTDDKTKVWWFVHPYSEQKFYSPGQINFDLGNYADKLPQEDITYLSGFPRVPKVLKTADKMDKK